MLIYPQIKEAPIVGLSGMGGGASSLVAVSADAGYKHEFTYSSGGSWSGTTTGDNASYPKENVFNGGTNQSGYQDAGGSVSSSAWVQWTFDPYIAFSSQVRVFFDGDNRSGTPKVYVGFTDGTNDTSADVSQSSGSLGDAEWLTLSPAGGSTAIRYVSYQGGGGGYWGMLYAIEVDGEHLTSTGTHTW